MSRETTNAIVVKSVDFSESSLILTLFTRKFGKINGLAKGARRLKNPFETSLDLLASIRLSFICKNTNSLDLLTEAKLNRRFRPTSRNLRGLYAGYYVAELLDAATAEYDPIPELWDLADQTLLRFQRDSDVFQRLGAFEAGLLDALGEFPSTRSCVECGQELPLDAVKNLERRILFAPVEGGVVCSRCRAEKQFARLIPTTIAALKGFENALELSNDENSRRFDSLLKENVGGAKARDAFRDLMNRYICRVLCKRPKMFAHMRFIASPLPPETPKFAVEEAIETPKIAVEEAIEMPKIAVEEAIETPKIAVEEAIETPKIAVDASPKAASAACR